MSPSGASSLPLEDETNPMYLSLKGRVRRPSAKLMDDPQPVAVKLVPAKDHLLQPLSAAVSLQIGVAEVVIDEEGEVTNSNRQIPETIESISASEWKLHGRRQKVRSSGRPRKRPPTPKQEYLVAVEDLPKEEPAEEPLVESKITEEELVDELSDSESTKIASSPFDGQGKRKRGRPFKGQEKPVEERLLIETSKIRRLIDDILRKSSPEQSTHEFCLKLRNIARDIDDAMVHFPVSSPAMGPTNSHPASLAHLESYEQIQAKPEQIVEPEQPEQFEEIEAQVDSQSAQPERFEEIEAQVDSQSAQPEQTEQLEQALRLDEQTVEE